MWSDLLSSRMYLNYPKMKLKWKVSSLFIILSLHLQTISSQGNNNNNGMKELDDGSTVSPNHSLRLDHIKLLHYFKKSYHKRLRGRLQIKLNDVTPSSVTVKWNLPQLLYQDSVLESNVVCETSTGFLLSKTHVTSRATYRLEHLHANTSYIVCVYMEERSASTNETILHISCEKSRTKPMVIIPPPRTGLRTDSIIAVVVTMGYISVMILIGYATWRWKTKKQSEDEAKEKLAIEEEEGYDDGVMNGGLGDSGGCGGSYRDDGADSGSRKERSSMRGSSQLLNNSDRLKGSSKGNGIETVTFSDSDVVLERNNWKHSSSADDVNGCLDFKRNSRGSAGRLSEMAETGNNHEKKRPKSQSVEDSPVKVTEITF